jgi:hypothetical protein
VRRGAVACGILMSDIDAGYFGPDEDLPAGGIPNEPHEPHEPHQHMNQHENSSHLGLAIFHSSSSSFLRGIVICHNARSIHDGSAATNPQPPLRPPCRRTPPQTVAGINPLPPAVVVAAVTSFLHPPSSSSPPPSASSNVLFPSRLRHPTSLQ